MLGLLALNLRTRILPVTVTLKQKSHQELTLPPVLRSVLDRSARREFSAHKSTSKAAAKEAMHELQRQMGALETEAMRAASSIGSPRQPADGFAAAVAKERDLLRAAVEGRLPCDQLI